MNKHITIIVDPEQKIFVIEKQIFLIANEEGLIRLDTEDLVVEVPRSVQGFEKELETLLTEEQRHACYEFLGNAKAITITSFASVLELDRSDTKAIIAIAIKNKVLVTGWNNTWRVSEKLIRERFLTITKNRFVKEKKNITPETTEEILERINTRDGAVEEKVIEPEVIEEQPKKCITRYVRPENKTVAPSISKAVHIIAEKKDYGSMSEVHLRKELDALQYELEVDKWGENRTPWHVHDEIKLVKAQLIGFDNRKNAEKYKQEVNSVNTKSITRLPDIKEKVKGSQTLPKKKSVQAPTPVLKKRS